MSLPKITFAILCYNYGSYLNQAIKSCLEQDLENVEVEVLVINDGSTDNTEEVCALYADQIRVISEGNQGFASSLTRAIQYATGDYVFLLDADDYFLNGKLAAFLPHLLKGKLYVHDLVFPLVGPDVVVKPTLMAGGSTSTIAVNRKAALDMLPVENELYFHVLRQMGHGFILDKAYTVYRFHSNSMTNRNEPGKWNIYLAGITHRLADKIEEKIARDELPHWFLPRSCAKKVAAIYRAQAYYNELEAALECGHRINSFKAFLEMIKYAYVSKTGLVLLHYKMFIRTLLGKPSFNRK